jgi:hypothetical protein
MVRSSFFKAGTKRRAGLRRSIEKGYLCLVLLNRNRPVGCRIETLQQHQVPSKKMPLVKLFAQRAMNKPIPLGKLQSALCQIWNTKPNTTKLILFRVDEWTDESFSEDVYVDIRAKATPDRTRDMVLDGMARVQQAFDEQGLKANIRLETYDGPNYFHLPPSPK